MKKNVKVRNIGRPISENLNLRSTNDIAFRKQHNIQKALTMNDDGSIDSIVQLLIADVEEDDQQSAMVMMVVETNTRKRKESGPQFTYSQSDWDYEVSKMDNNRRGWKGRVHMNKK